MNAEQEIPAPQKVRNFLAFQRNAVLGTVSRSHEDFPFGSLTPYDVDKEGRLIILISTISEHYRNISRDSRASLCVTDQFGIHDPQAHARATALGRFEAVPEDEEESARVSYEKRFPEAKERSKAHGFLLFRSVPERVRWIGGFGEILWISAENYNSAQHDQVAYHGMGAVEHMNDDHKDTFELFLKRFSNTDPGQSKMEMVSIDSSGFELSLKNTQGSKRVKIPFLKPLSEGDGVREMMIEMLKIAREDLET